MTVSRDRKYRRSTAGFVAASLAAVGMILGSFVAIKVTGESAGRVPDDLSFAAVAVMAGVVLTINLFIVPGWVAALGLPSKKVSSAIIGIVGVLAALLAPLDVSALAYLAAASVFLSFIGEMLRTDGRDNLVGSVGGTYLGCLMVIGTALWVVTLSYGGVGILFMAIPVVLIGTLARYLRMTSLPRTVRRAWAWAGSTALFAFIGGMIFEVVVIPPASMDTLGSYLGALVPPLVVAAICFGLVSAALDHAAYRLESSEQDGGIPLGIMLGLAPYCALGFITYGLSLVLL